MITREASQLSMILQLRKRLDSVKLGTDAYMQKEVIYEVLQKASELGIDEMYLISDESTFELLSKGLTQKIK